MRTNLLRSLATAAVSAALLLGVAIHARAGDDEAKRILAPSGTLKVGLYPGTPTSILQPDAQTHDQRGVGFDLGREIARKLDVPYAPVVFLKNAEVLEAVKTGQVDMAFTNASAARAREMDFGPPYLEIELGYLVPQTSTITALADIDGRGHRVGVTAGSSSDAALSKDLKAAEVVRAPSITAAVEMLRSGQIEAFATNKATLFEMAEKLPGAKVLDGQWGVERHAIAIPKGREQGLPFVTAFTRDAAATGLVKAAIARAGLRGAVVSEVK